MRLTLRRRHLLKKNNLENALWKVQPQGVLFMSINFIYQSPTLSPGAGQPP